LGFAFAFLPGVAHADVNLEWRPAYQEVTVGSNVSIGLYAVSDNVQNQPIAALDALLSWDPSLVILTGRVNNGPYRWFASWFPADNQLDALNSSWLDGNAFYQAFGPLAPAPPAEASPEGLLITTVTFEADAPGEAVLSFLPDFGKYSHTRVLHGTKTGMDVTGQLGSATVVVLDCGASSDVDEDCDVDVDDFGGFAECLLGPTVDPGTSGCEVHDSTLNGRVDLKDFAHLQRSFYVPATE